MICYDKHKMVSNAQLTAMPNEDEMIDVYIQRNL